MSANPVFIPSLVVGEALPALPGVATISASVAFKYVSKTANYTASNSDKTIECTENSFTIFLPSAVGIAGREYVIKNSSLGTVITVAALGSETIDGAATFLLQKDSNPTNVNCISVTSNGAAWSIIGKVTN